MYVHMYKIEKHYLHNIQYEFECLARTTNLTPAILNLYVGYIFIIYDVAVQTVFQDKLVHRREQTIAIKSRR